MNIKKPKITTCEDIDINEIKNIEYITNYNIKGTINSKIEINEQTIDTCIFTNIDFTNIELNKVDLVDCIFENCNLSNKIFDNKLITSLVFLYSFFHLFYFIIFFDFLSYFFVKCCECSWQD